MPGLTAIITSAGLFVEIQKADVWSFITNCAADEDRMRELREKFGMYLTRCASPMSHLTETDKQALGDLTKSMTAATNHQDQLGARQQLAQLSAATTSAAWMWNR